MDFFSRQPPPHERPPDGRGADGAAGVGLEAPGDLRVRHRGVLGEVPVNPRTVVVRDEPRRGTAVGLGHQRARFAVELAEALNGGDGDAEAGSDLGGGGRAGRVEDAATEVGGKRSGHGRSYSLNATAERYTRSK